VIIIIIIIIVVCGGIIDANIKGKIEFSIENVTSFLCQWDFPNTNGTVVIATNFKVFESKLSCSNDNFFMVTDGRYLILFS